jgi:hypothetical protein
MNARRLHVAMWIFLACASIATAADAPPRTRTPAEESVDQGSGTVANGGAAPLGSSGGTTGGTTIGSGVDTTATPGLAVDSGTVMRPLSAQGRNAPAPKKEQRRKQLYGLNPKADDASPPQGSAR